jgi:hypothetical protein
MLSKKTCRNPKGKNMLNLLNKQKGGLNRNRKARVPPAPENKDSRGPAAREEMT